MLISEIIAFCKENSQGYGRIDENFTRDKILYGDPNKECTGIVTTIYASVDVIKEAARRGANLIISHEACFWNHGDHTDWLQDNRTFIDKKALLDETGIVVWRDHDYIHSGVQWNGEWVDGIFYGLATELDWLDYVIQDKKTPRCFQIPKTPTQDVIQYLMEKMDLNGMKCMGNLDGYTERIYIPMHIIGQADNSELAFIEENKIDTLLCMEITDFTVAIYMRDGAQLGYDKAVLVPGHFNTEEPGMKWFGEVYLPEMLPQVPSSYCQAGDSYTMMVRRVR